MPTRPAGLPNWDTVRKWVDRRDFDVFVFIGHGIAGERGFGLLFEEPEALGGEDFPSGSRARYSDPKWADDLTGLFSTKQVPVAVFIGCQTGASVDAGTRERLQGYIRGSLGVAERLVRNRPQVRCVVGMQQNVTGPLAVSFLESFFEKLLRGESPGHIEAAVRGDRAWRFKATRNSHRLTRPRSSTASSPWNRCSGSGADRPCGSLPP